MESDKPTIKPQSQLPEKLVLPLDAALFNSSPQDLASLKKSVSEDEEVIRVRVNEVQEECVL